MSKDANSIPHVLPVSCLAAVVARGGRSLESILRQYKFKETAEGHARIICHPPAITLIRNFYRQSRDPKLLDAATAEWRMRADKTVNKSVRARFLNNAVSIDRARVHLVKRDLQVLTNHKITCRVGQIVFRASPDLWVRENGEERLIKIGFGKKDRSYVDALLIVMRRAAIGHGFNIPARNVVYLHAPTGQEFASRFRYEDMVLTLTGATREIAEIWPRVKQKSGKSPRGRAAAAGL